jgi:hypothetical protein
MYFPPDPCTLSGRGLFSVYVNNNNFLFHQREYANILFLKKIILQSFASFLKTKITGVYKIQVQ